LRPRRWDGGEASAEPEGGSGRGALREEEDGLTEESTLRLDRTETWDRAVAAALDLLLSRRGEGVRASAIWAAVQARGKFRILVLSRDGSEVDRTEDRATQIAEVRILMTALHRRAHLAEPSDASGDAADPEYVVLR